MPADHGSRPPRLRPLRSESIDNVAGRVHASVPGGADEISEAELLGRLEDALAALPDAERAAAVVAFGLAEGSPGVAEELGIDEADAEALSRNALQLLRGAMGDVDASAPEVYARLRRRRRHLNQRPGDGLEHR